MRDELNPKVIIAAGLPGVGKSTVLSIVKQELGAAGITAEIINFGDFMLDYLKNKGLIKDRDEIRKVSLSTQREAQAASARGIRKYFERRAAEVGGGFVGFVDTHVLIKTPTGLWPGLPEHVIKELRPDSIVLIEAKPEDIVARQMKDKTRYRADYSDINLIKELTSLMRVYAMASAVLVGASVNFVINEEGNPKKAAEKVVKIIRGL